MDKRCSKCGSTLPASQFNKAKWLSSGLRPDCKSCYSEAKKAAWAQKPKSEFALRKAENAALAEQGLRKCKGCGEIKAAVSEEYTSVNSGTLNSTCRKCDAAKTRRWAKENPDRYKANAAAGWASRRAKQIYGTMRLSAEHKAQMREIYAECRRRNKGNPRAWHVDHIYPLRGRNACGLHVPWNLQIIPASQNVRKSNKCPTTTQSF